MLQRETQAVPKSNEHSTGGERDKADTDEDYVPEKKSLRTKRRAYLIPKPSSSESTGNGSVLDAGTLRTRRGVTEPVECPTCHKSFLSKYYLKVHNRQVLLVSSV